MMRRRKTPTHRLGMDRLESRDAPAVVPVGNEFRVNDVTAWMVDEPAVALDGDGDFVVAWQAMDADGSDNAIFIRRYSKDGIALGGDIQVNSFTIGSQQRPSIASDAAGNFIVVWGSASAQDGSREGVYARRYDVNGQPITGEFRINQFTLNIQGNASVAMDGDGDFVVTWESNYQDGDGYAIYARRYNSAGDPLGNEFQVNSVTLGDQRYPSVAMGADNSFVIAWEGPDQNLDGVYARRFDGNGQSLGLEFQVNTTSTHQQTRPRVAADVAGNFAVVWESAVQDSGTAGVYVRRYSSSGSPITSEIRVNTYTTSDQLAPRVAANAAGELIVTWQSNQQDGDGGGIYGQRIGIDGALLGNELRIHTTTLGDQVRPAVGTDIYGDFVVAWPSYGGTTDGIYAQRYYRPPAPRADVMIDDGHPQRSSILSVTLTFNTLVNIGVGGVRLIGPQGVSTSSYDFSQSTNTQSIVKVTFSGNNVTAGGLINGNYTLALLSSLITNYNDEGYDGNGDGVPGPGENFAFHRLFGDYDGNRHLNSIDFAGFRANFGLNSSSPAFHHYFDADGDGDTDAFDFAVFRTMFGLSLAP